MHISKASVSGNEFVGLFAKTSDRITLVGTGTGAKLSSACAVLKTEIVGLGVSGSQLAGVYCAMNSNGLLLPVLAEKEEISKLISLDMNCSVMKTKLTALGFNIAANDSGALINPRFSREEEREIGDCLGVETVKASIGPYNTVGAACIATNNGFVMSSRARDEDVELAESLFKVKGVVGTANMGVGMVGLCVIANRNGFVAGEGTSGFEISRMDEGLGFIR